MAYVMFGRVESINDLYIAGKFDPKKIKCHPDAKATSDKLYQLYAERMEAEKVLDQSSFIVSYVNVRSKQAHYADVKIDPILMRSHVFALGETWSEEDYPENGFDNFTEYSDVKPKGQGRGKGLSAYSSVNCNFRKYSCPNNTASAIFLMTEKLNIIFLYLSGKFEWDGLKYTLDEWICDDKPTVIMGDCNWHFGDSHSMKTYLKDKGYSQLISRATQQEGNIIDHLYICPMAQRFSYKIVHQGVYYSDHDIIGIKISF